MVHWLDQGFVQDSDEDEDLAIDIEPATQPPPTFPHDTTRPRLDVAKESTTKLPNGDRNVQKVKTAPDLLGSPSDKRRNSNNQPHNRALTVDAAALPEDGLTHKTPKRTYRGPRNPTPAGHGNSSLPQEASMPSVDIFDIPSSDPSQAGPPSSSSVRDRIGAAPSTPATEARDNTPSILKKTAIEPNTPVVLLEDVPPPAEVHDLSDAESQSASSRPSALQVESQARQYSMEPPLCVDPALPMDVSPTALLDTPGMAQRKFRTRNPVQLHPYQFDRQQYHMTLFGTGYRPVHVADKAQRQQRSRSASIASGDASNSSVFSMGSAPSSPARPQVETRPRQILASPSQNDFPDMDPVGRTSHPGEARAGFKKQKTGHVIDKSNEAGRKRSALSPLSSDDEDVAAALAAAREKQPQAKRAQFRDPRKHHRLESKWQGQEVKPVAQPPLVWTTPSESEGDSGGEIVDSRRRQSASSRPTQGTRQRAISLDSESSAQSRSSSGEERDTHIARSDGKHLQNMRHRMRGVLPASWLRLDQKEQAPQQRQHHQQVSKTASTPVRGVAKRVNKPSHITPSRENNEPVPVVEISDDSSSSSHPVSPHPDSPLKARTDAREPSPRPAHALFDSFGDDVVVEDFVDPMIPPVSRPRLSKITGSKARTKTQTRLTETINNFTREKKSMKSSRPRQTVSATRVHSQKQQRLRPKHPKRSILDSIEDRESADGTPLPDFVRLAMRHARKRRDKGRHSPSTKLISWHCREDSLVIDNGLRQWKSGNIKTSKNYPTAARRATSQKPKPLHEAKTAQNRQAGNPAGQGRTVQPVASLVDIDAHPAFPSYFLSSSTAPQQPPTLGGYQKSRLSATHTSKPKRSDYTRPHARPGVLEELQPGKGQSRSTRTFQFHLSALNRSLHHKDNSSTGHANPMLDRFLHDEEAVPLPTTSNQTTEDASLVQARPEATPEASVPTETTRRRNRVKQKPIRLIVDENEQEGNILTDSPLDMPAPSASEPVNKETASFQGLGPIGSAYTTDFGVSIMPTGLCFHQGTFLGSGAFQAACTFANRDLDVPAGHTVINLATVSLRLGAWNEATLSSLQRLFRRLVSVCDLISAGKGQPVDENGTALSMATLLPTLEKVTQWLTYNLSFLDPIDRQEFVPRLLGLLSDVSVLLPPESADMDISMLGLHVAVWTYQCFRLAVSNRDQAKLSSQILDVFESVARWTLRQIVTHGSPTLWAIHDRLHLRQVAEAGIKDAGALQALVGLHNLAEQLPLQSTQVWIWLDEAIAMLVPDDAADIGRLEPIWHTIFATLPLFGFDSAGLYDRRKRVTLGDAGMVSVNKLVSGVLGFYKTASNATQANGYIRALLARTFRLVKHWGWVKCDSLCKKMFDFFAQRGFAMLDGEDVTGSFEYLQHITAHAVPTLASNERSFHIFLKIMVLFLHELHGMTDKKARGITFRFIPNHGRTHAKDQELRQEDLAAIRNQHDLVTALYCASPAAARPRITVLQGLVDFKSSHSEVCRLQIRTWANMMRFQLTTNEADQSVSQLTGWYSDMLQQLVGQHRGARVETESYREKHPHVFLTKESIESVIANNQRQVEALMSMALSLLRELIETGGNDGLVKRVFQETCLEPALGLFEPGFSRLSKMLCEALGVYKSYASRKVALCHKTPVQSESSKSDSQDYGDFPDLDDFSDDAGAGGEAGPQQAQGANSGDAQALGALRSFFSDCFGSEAPVDEQLLENLVEAWVKVAHSEVASQRHSWDYYLDEHGPGAWSRLRQTTASIQMQPFYLSTILSNDATALSVGGSNMVSAWLVSLMERESLLKYQHCLTSSLLNASAGQSRLFYNLPFARDGMQKRYTISLEELRGRRIQLLSSVFDNMRSLWYGHGEMSRMDQALDLKMLVRQVMHTMKANYEATSQDTSTRGSYVVFVQQVVELLQQYTSEIQPVDKFFTDSAAFPLPTDDPTYVVGKLKSYCLRLGEAKTQKQLLAFVQNSVERAVVEGQQSYLIEQMTRALDAQREGGADSAPSLRRVLLVAIFPCYIQAALESECGFLLAQPILSVMTRACEQLVYFCGLGSEAAMSSATSIMSHCASTAAASINTMLGQVGLCAEASALRTLRQVLEAAQPLVGLADYVHSLSRGQSPHVRQVAYLRQQVGFLRGLLVGSSEGEGTDMVAGKPLGGEFAEVAAACSRDLRASLAREWKREADGGYKVARGQGFREVAVDLELAATELALVVREADGFVEAYDYGTSLPAVGLPSSAGGGG